MQIRNPLGLSQIWVDAVTNDPYDHEGFWRSVTELINPPRAVLLKQRHDDEIIVNVEDRLWMLMGSLAHMLLERAGKQYNIIQEQRFIIEVNGMKIGFKPDQIVRLDNESEPMVDIRDAKFTSVWGLIGGPKPEYEAQLNCYAYGLHKHNFVVNNLWLEVFGRDWRWSEYLRKHDYPDCQVDVQQIELWPMCQIEDFLKTRVAAFLKAELLPDDELPFCTPEERWAKPTYYKVYKIGNVNPCHGGAKFTDRHSAEQFAEKYKEKHSTTKTKVQTKIVKVPGDSTRCTRYCDASPFCNQWNDIIRPELEGIADGAGE